MTAYEFDMKQINFMGQGEWEINVSDGDTKIKTVVYDEAVQECIRDEFDNISDTVKDVLTQRAVIMWDKYQMTDTEKAIFLEILGKVIG